jgi:hypothetical protein
MDPFYWFVLAGGFLLAGLAMILFYRHSKLGKDAMEARIILDKLQLKVNEASGLLRKLSGKGSDVVENGLGNIGLDGLLKSVLSGGVDLNQIFDQFNVPKTLRPMIQGMVTSYLNKAKSSQQTTNDNGFL